MMTLKEEIIVNAGIKTAEDYLTEGLVFFKTSDRLKGFVKVLNKKIVKISSTAKPSAREDIKALDALKNTCVEAINKFETVEAKFKEAEKEERKKLKADYNSLKIEYHKLLKLSQREDVQKALLTAGIALLFVVSLLSAMFFLRGIFMAISSITLASDAIAGTISAEVAGTALAKPLPVLMGASLAGAISGATADKMKDKLKDIESSEDVFNVIEEMKRKENKK